MPFKPRKGYLAGGNRPSYGRRSSVKELEMNPEYTLGETNDLPYNVGGGSNWFSRIFNPPNQTAIEANNQYLTNRLQGDMQNMQVLELEAERKRIADEMLGRHAGAFFGPNDTALLGENFYPLNDAAFGERVNVALGPQIKEKGAALAIPQATLDRTNLAYLDKLSRTPTYERMYNYSALSKLHPRVQLPNMVFDPAADPEGGGRVYEGAREESYMKQQTYTDPKTGKPTPIPMAFDKYIRNIQPRVRTYNQFQGEDAVGYDEDEIRSILQPTAPTSPSVPKNERVTSPYGQANPPNDPFQNPRREIQDIPAGIMDDPNLAPREIDWSFPEGSLPDMYQKGSRVIGDKSYLAAEKARKLYQTLKLILSKFGVSE